MITVLQTCLTRSICNLLNLVYYIPLARTPLILKFEFWMNVPYGRIGFSYLLGDLNQYNHVLQTGGGISVQKWGNFSER